MAVTISFSSPGNPPHNIVSFRVERSVRPAAGSIALVGDVNNVTKVVIVAFSGPVPAIGALAGDQMHIGGTLYRVLTNTATTITFTADTDLSTIVSFPAAFVIVNDLAEFSSFEFVGLVSPTLPFPATLVHQFNDPTGTQFDFYQVKTIDSGGNISLEPLTKPFRPGQVITLAIDEIRKAPKDSLTGIIGGSITFEVEVIVGGRRQDPKDNVVNAEIFIPSYLAPDGQFRVVESIVMARVGPARYRATWAVPTNISNPFGNFTVYPADDYVVSYKANFIGLVGSAPDSFIEFASEMFTLVASDGPIFGRFPSYASVEDLRQTLFEIDAYLPESIPKTDLNGRNKVLQYHIERASDKLREELNYHQLRGNSSDRQEYVSVRSIYTLLMAARGQNSSAVSDKFLEQWEKRAIYILAQLKREGVAQGIPLGRG